MNNYVKNGDIVFITAAPYAAASGAGMLMGSMFGVATTAITSGGTGNIQVTGVVSIAKLSAEAWTQGALVYWDNTAKNATIVSTSNKLIGVANAAAANPSAVGELRLNGAFIS